MIRRKVWEVDKAFIYKEKLHFLLEKIKKKDGEKEGKMRMGK